MTSLHGVGGSGACDDHGSDYDDDDDDDDDDGDDDDEEEEDVIMLVMMVRMMMTTTTATMMPVNTKMAITMKMKMTKMRMMASAYHPYCKSQMTQRWLSVRNSEESVVKFADSFCFFRENYENIHVNYEKCGHKLNLLSFKEHNSLSREVA